mmetsp:Transcript_63306/g.151003  ORF Transcript_63306/g.151003 Transcript_63306/m.151003 type:complete len:692 (-) Transcript_63306:121-2196(-)
MIRQFLPDGRDVLKLALGVGLFRLLWVRFIRRSFVLGDRSSSDSGAKSAAKKADAKGGTNPEDGVWIYFGSQSGTAEGFASELQDEAAQHGLQANVVDLEEFDAEVMARHRCVVLVVATYGEGDPTDNAMDFFRWLKDTTTEDLLKGVQYTVMGLGNRQYIHFNQCAKDADKHMARLGAKSIYVRGEGDDDQNIEEDFEQWKEGGLWPALQSALGEAVAPAGHEDANAAAMTAEEVLSKLQLKAEISAGQPSRVDPLVQVGGTDVLGKWYFAANQASISVERELRQKPDVTSGLTTKHLEVDISALPALNWKTADNLEVLPENPEQEVLWFARRLGVEDDLDKSISFVRAPGVDKAVRKPFPTPCTVRTALALFCDLVTAPHRSVARRLAALVKNEAEHKAIVSLIEDREAYQWLTGPEVRLSFREMFAFFFTTAEVDLSTFLQLCPRQKSRPYTISSSSREDSRRIGICVSMVSEKLKTLRFVVEELAKRGHDVPSISSSLQALGSELEDNRRYCGVCSTMLCTRSAVGDKLWIAVKASSFRLPRKTTTPVIMIGAGTGLAPFRAFVREFRVEGGARKKTSLFFGCCRSDQDFIYRDELEEAVQMKPQPALGELITAFSREQEKKVYVQHRLQERLDDLRKLLTDEKAYVFVCGSVAMGEAVREQVVAALKSKDALKRLEDEGRFVTELW